jgi:hypothetical protein
MKNREKKQMELHKNVLYPSSQDTIGLSEAVQDRFLDVAGLHERVRHTEIPIPVELDSAMILWRTMVVRHRTGDLRSSQEEEQALKEFAEWTLEINAELRNQKKPKIEWQS